MATLAVHADDAAWRRQVDADLKVGTTATIYELTTDENGQLRYPGPKDDS